MALKLKGTAKLFLAAGKAAPSPAIGQALGPLGINMMAFCKEFNERSKPFKENIPLQVVVTAYQDRSFTFLVKTPTTGWLLKQCAGIEKGSDFPTVKIAGYVSVKEVYEIGKIKKLDKYLDHIPLRSFCAEIMGTARSMGINVTRE